MGVGRRTAIGDASHGTIARGVVTFGSGYIKGLLLSFRVKHAFWVDSNVMVNLGIAQFFHIAFTVRATGISLSKAVGD